MGVTPTNARADDVEANADYDSKKVILPSPSGSESDADSEYRKHLLYEPADTWENKHRWDPAATWTPEEQRKLTRRLDWRVTLPACIFFAALQLDRGNISNALSDNLLGDIGITTGDYNVGMTIFYVSFLFAELPSQMISKKLGSDVWIPIQMMLWSIVAIGQAGLNGKASFFVTRCLLGLIEGGFIADTILYLSYYYTAGELTLRLTWFWISYTLTNIIGAFLAAGLLLLRNHTNTSGWRWLFGIEGGMTFLVGVWAQFYLPPGPTQTHRSLWGRIRGKGWFTEREEVIIVNKVIRDDPTKSDMHNREGLGLKQIWLSLTDYDLWPLYALGLIHQMAPGTIQAYFTLTLKAIGYSTFNTNLLTIPANILAIVQSLFLAWLQRRTNQRVWTASLSNWWLLIMMIALISIPDDANPWTRWTLLTLIKGYPYAHPLLVSMNSMNAGSVRTRTVASSVYNMFVQAGSLISSNVYQPSDAPYYHKGNRVLLGVIAVTLVVFIFTKFWYVWRNDQRAKIWDAMTKEEQETYIKTTTDQGNKRLDYRFLH